MVTGILSFNSLFCFLLTFIAQVTLEGRKIRVGEGEEKRKILVSSVTGLKTFPLHSVPLTAISRPGLSIPQRYTINTVGLHDLIQSAQEIKSSFNIRFMSTCGNGRILWWEMWFTSERPGVSCRNVCGTQVQIQPTLKCQLNLNNLVEKIHVL